MKGNSIMEKIQNNIVFLLHFIRYPRRVGTPLPCARSIGSAVARELENAGASKVVELGSGLGSITQGILDAIDHSTRLLCIEKTPAFCQQLKNRFEDRVVVVQGNALELKSILSGTEWDKPDAVVCSIPMANDFAGLLCNEIAKVLYPDKLFLQVTNYNSAIEEYFTINKTLRFMANVPPEQLHIAIPREGLFNK
ncbi:MAG: NAD-binding protein [Spirochaetota bacterium]